MTNVLPFGQRVRGRAAPARQRHTFIDSGITVELHKIGPTTMMRLSEGIRREAERLPEGHPNKYPEPPVEDIDIGGVLSLERNINSPDYIEALATWQRWANTESNNRFLRIAAADAVIPIDTSDEDIAIEAARVRRRMAAEGVEIPAYAQYDQAENDRIVWVSYVCIASVQDLQEFYAVLTQRTVVSEEAIEDHTATFRPAVSA